MVGRKMWRAGVYRFLEWFKVIEDAMGLRNSKSSSKLLDLFDTSFKGYWTKLANKFGHVEDVWSKADLIAL